MTTPIDDAQVKSVLIAAAHTPMKEDGSLNLDVVPKQISLLRNRGVDGAIVCGTMGEGPLLSTAERMAIAEAWGQARKGLDFLMVNVGHNCLQEASLLARHAADSGADALAMYAPTYFKPHTVDALVTCCAVVAESAPNIPFYYYHAPHITGIRLKMTSFLLRAADVIPNLRGLKYSDSSLADYEACMSLDNGRFDIYFGVDEMVLGTLAFGSVKAIGCTYNFAAQHYRQMIDAFWTGDIQRARMLSSAISGLSQALEDVGDVAASKVCMSLFGVDCGPVRPPLQHPTPADTRRLTERLIELGFL